MIVNGQAVLDTDFEEIKRKFGFDESKAKDRIIRISEILSLNVAGAVSFLLSVPEQVIKKSA